MKILTITILLIISILSPTYSQNDCQIATGKAKIDYKNSDFSLHSDEFYPSENTYLYVLEKYYKIKWFFTDSFNFYHCYDSVMTSLLENNYGNDFLKKASILADSLENTENWTKDAEFNGGRKELFKFISIRLLGESIKMDSSKTNTRAIVQFEIDSTGKVRNPIVWRGINPEIDNKIVKIINQLPDWKPAYLYGKPIRQFYTIPINIELK